MAKINLSLHIGAHKTATTHLQRSLLAAKEMLIVNGVRYYGPDYFRRTGRSIGAMFGLAGDDGPAPRRTPAAQLAFLAKGDDHVLLSEENFIGASDAPGPDGKIGHYAAAEHRVAALVGQIDNVRLRLFLGIRDPADFLTSAYSQFLLTGRIATSRRFRREHPLAAVDWADLVVRLRAVRGVRHLYIWRYEDHADVAPLVLTRMMPGPAGRQITLIPRRINAGLSANALADLMARHKAGENGNLAEAARRAFPVGRRHPRIDIFDTEDQTQSAAAYTSQVARIAAMPGVTLLRPRGHDVADKA
jgi:hypothetical protein